MNFFILTFLPPRRFPGSLSQQISRADTHDETQRKQTKMKKREGMLATPRRGHSLQVIVARMRTHAPESSQTKRFQNISRILQM